MLGAVGTVRMHSLKWQLLLLAVDVIKCSLFMHVSPVHFVYGDVNDRSHHLVILGHIVIYAGVITWLS